MLYCIINIRSTLQTKQMFTALYTMGYKNLKRYLYHVSYLWPRRSHTQTIRPRQWHIARGGHTVEKEF